MYSRLPTILLCSILAAAAPGQTESAPPKAAGEREKPIHMTGPEEGLTEAETMPRPGLNKFAHSVLAFRPERIAPGESGNAHLVLALRSLAVLKVGTHFELDYKRVQGPIQLGEWRLEEPRRGTLPTLFKGFVVYDNTAMAVIPVSVAADASHQAHLVRIDVVADVTDAQTAHYRGRFSETVRGRLEVGPAIPRPTPVAAISRETSSPAREGAGIREKEREPGSPAIEAAEPGTVPESFPAPLGPETGTADPTDQGTVGGGSETALIVGAAGLLGAALLLVLVRSRRP